MRHGLRLTTAMLALGLAACASDDDEPGSPGLCAEDSRAELYRPGMVRLGPSGLGVTLLESVPGPPARFDNAWTVEVRDAAGAVSPGASLTVTPFMPDHGHGSPIAAEVTADGDGGFELAPINLWMPGLWEVRLDLALGDQRDRVVFAFCVEE